MKIFAKIFIKCLLAANVLLVWPIAVYAEPTVAETQEFITGQAKKCGSFTYKDHKFNQNDPYSHMRDHNRYTDYVLEISFVNDEVHTKETYNHLHTSINTSSDARITWNDYHATYSGISKLSDLSPIVEMRDAEKEDEGNEDYYRSPVFILECSTDNCWKQQVHFEGDELPRHYEGGVIHGNTGESIYYTCNLDAAQRIAKAFIYLIKKSGGKEPLF